MRDQGAGKAKQVKERHSGGRELGLRSAEPAAVGGCDLRSPPFHDVALGGNVISARGPRPLLIPLIDIG
jgi:hypothetical protein